MKLRSDASLEQVYRLGKTIAEGGYSRVRLATERASGQQYACKVMPLPRQGRHSRRRRRIMREIDALLGLDHPNVVGLKEYFVQGHRVYLIMELLRGGELLDALNARGHYSEDDARTVFRQLIAGVAYLHSNGVVHRDLKLDNLLLVEPGDIGRIKIADFGTAHKLHPGDVVGQLKTACGTPHYMAPEVVCANKHILVDASGSPYGPACDLWSCGVILYTLLSGCLPFWEENQPKLLRAISKGEYDFGDPVWQEVSPKAKNLIARLLMVDPARRLTCHQVLAHPWMAESGSQQPLLAAAERIRGGVVDRLRKRGSEQALRLHHVIAEASAAAAAGHEAGDDAG